MSTRDGCAGDPESDDGVVKTRSAPNSKTHGAGTATTERLVRTRPPATAIVIGATVAVATGLVSAAALWGVVGVVRRLLGDPADAGNWVTLTLLAGLTTFAVAVTRTLVASVLPMELHLDPRRDRVELWRPPFAPIRITRSAIREVRVSGRRTRGGRGRVTVRLVTRRRRHVLIVDSSRDWDAVLARTHAVASAIADRIGVGVVTEGWARDPGVGGSRGFGSVHREAID